MTAVFKSNYKLKLPAGRFFSQFVYWQETIKPACSLLVQFICTEINLPAGRLLSKVYNQTVTQTCLQAVQLPSQSTLQNCMYIEGLILIWTAYRQVFLRICLSTRNNKTSLKPACSGCLYKSICLQAGYFPKSATKPWLRPACRQFSYQANPLYRIVCK